MRGEIVVQQLAVAFLRLGRHLPAAAAHALAGKQARSQLLIERDANRPRATVVDDAAARPQRKNAWRLRRGGDQGLGEWHGRTGDRHGTSPRMSLDSTPAYPASTAMAATCRIASTRRKTKNDFSRLARAGHWHRGCRNRLIKNPGRREATNAAETEWRFMPGARADHRG